jgi:hypothetical protein
MEFLSDGSGLRKTVKSPRFDIRAAPLRKIFTPQNLESTWRKKVRLSLREQYVNDGVEFFDFHIARRIQCSKLSNTILDGSYLPAPAERILVEKGKGLCRQLVIPSPEDALVLQCLSDALYLEVRKKAPTNRSFFEPKDHRFSTGPQEYGTFASWLNFQRTLFKFTKTKDFVVVTDIANYYDSISYVHLRNVIAGIAGVDESVLDMLIFVLSSLLWQPDYTPRIEVGLPQINIDAPRLLAHCFLYELDAYLASDESREFVRYMDDIDIGVDDIAAAKRTLKEVDLVLQTKQVRLNSGKTRILTRDDALHHFRIPENARLDALQDRIKRRRAAGLSLRRDRRLVELRVRRGLRRKAFDDGNGEKVLKRWIGLAGTLGARISPADLSRIIVLRPSVRENVFALIGRSDLTPSRSRVLADCSRSGYLVDDAAKVGLVNHLVETAVVSRAGRHANILSIVTSCDPLTYFGLYSRLWLQSKYDDPVGLLKTILEYKSTWIPHYRLGRLVGSFAPLFVGTPEQERYLLLLLQSRNEGFRETYMFHRSLVRERGSFEAMYSALRNPNLSRGTGITHAKFLCLLSSLQNSKVDSKQIEILIDRNSRAFRDIYYRTIARRLRLM